MVYFLGKYVVHIHTTYYPNMETYRNKLYKTVTNYSLVVFDEESNGDIPRSSILRHGIDSTRKRHSGRRRLSSCPEKVKVVRCQFLPEWVVMLEVTFTVQTGLEFDAL